MGPFLNSIRSSLLGAPCADSSLPLTPSTAASTPASSVSSSPFFAPSSKTPILSSTTVTPGGTRRLRRRKDKAEAKSTVPGATFNLINGIVGAGIVGIPFAVKEAGLVSGIGMIVLSALLTVKSLRLLIETAKHIDVQSYETLLEAAFGRFGFYFISLAMLCNAYGAMVSYLMIIKETLPTLLGYAPEDVDMARVVLTASTLLVIFPLSLQRDMAALAATSIVSVCFDLVMVAIVVVVSPVPERVEAAGGVAAVISHSTIHWDTFFVGVGVLSFAFVCQHASFIIAGSLDRPTKQRWGMVTGNALTFCGCLAVVCGTVGYLGFLDQTDGNILNNLGEGPYAYAAGPSTHRLAMLARGLMCTCMFLVYPIESFVARHVLIVLFFRGRRAHEGDDHSVLARRDRRLALTLVLYLLALTPALTLESLGPVLAISGSLGGSSLSYIGPGAVYLAVHGQEFRDMVKKRWNMGGNGGEGGDDEDDGPPSAARVDGILNKFLWYLTFMPLWCGIASIGLHYLAKHEEEEALKSPHIGRLGKVVHHHKAPGQVPRSARGGGGGGRGGPRILPPTIPGAGTAGGGGGARRSSDYDSADDETADGGEKAPLMSRSDSMPRTAAGGSSHIAIQYGAAATATGGVSGSGRQEVMTDMGNRGIAAAIAAKNAAAADGKGGADEEVEDDPQDDPPTLYDYSVAIFLFVFGLIAATAGTIATLMP